MSLRTTALCALLAGTALGCGGKQAKYYTVDEEAIVGASAEMRLGIREAKAEQAAADQELKQAQALQASAERDVNAVRMDIKAAQLELDRAGMEYPQVERSGDPERVRYAMEGMKAARLAVQAEEAREEWARKKLDAAVAGVEEARRHWDAATARLEQEKARVVAQGESIPADFSMARFDRQAAAARLEYANARVASEKIKEEAKGLERNYRVIKRAQETAEAASKPAQPRAPAVP